MRFSPMSWEIACLACPGKPVPVCGSRRVKRGKTFLCRSAFHYLHVALCRRCVDVVQTFLLRATVNFCWGKVRKNLSRLFEEYDESKGGLPKGNTVDTLCDTVAIVTGASRGIGNAIARRFAAEGASVVVTARTMRAGESKFTGSLEETVAQIEAVGGTTAPIVADLSVEEDRERLVAEAERLYGQVDILVNNAAVTFFRPVADFSMNRFHLMMEVQVASAFDLSQRVLPGMLARERGWILQVSSLAARHPQGPPYLFQIGGGGTVYGMCKAALERFTTGLASEVYDKGIAVNCLSPSGVVATPGVMHHKLIPAGMEEHAEPVEAMADAALSLCSGDPKKMTGKVVYSLSHLAEMGIEPQPL